MIRDTLNEAQRKGLSDMETQQMLRDAVREAGENHAPGKQDHKTQDHKTQDDLRKAKWHAKRAAKRAARRAAANHR